MAQVPLSTRLEMSRLWFLSVGMYAGALLKIALGKGKEGEFDMAAAKAFLKQTRSELKWVGERGLPTGGSETKI